MEETSLERKIKKQLEYIRDQVVRFSRSFESKNFKSNNYIPYLEAINRVFDVNNSYGEDYFQFIQKKNLQFILANNRLLMKDITAKLKALSTSLQNNNVLTEGKTQSFSDGICKLCNLHIESQSIEVAKNKVVDDGIKQLKRMLDKIEAESNQALFSEEEDKYFFQELMKALNSKEELLSITENHLEKYLNDVMKNMQEIKYLEDLKDTSFPLPTSVNWEAKIKNEIHYVLVNSFKGKIPPWIHKAFGNLGKINEKMMRQLRQSQECQTDPYTPNEVIELRKQVQRWNQQEKIKKAINQDYIKTIQEKQEKIKKMEIQISALNQTLFSGDRHSIKVHSRQSKNNRNSSLSNLTEIIEPRKSKFQRNPSSLFNDVQASKNNLDQSHQIDQGENLPIYGTQLRKDQSLTEHNGVSMFSNHTMKRRIHKKFADDISFNSNSMSKERNKSFLPLITRTSADSLQIPEFNLKKSNSLAHFQQNQKKTFGQQQIVEQNQGTLNDIKSKSIIEADENGLSESELNLTKQKSDQQKKLRIKKYRQTITDVKGLMEKRASNNSDAIKKIKKSSLLSLSSKWNPTHNHTTSRFSQIQTKQQFPSSIVSSKQRPVQKIDASTQSQTVESSFRQRAKSQQKNTQSGNVDSNLSRFKQTKKAQTVCIEIQTDQTKESLMKRLEQTNIEEDQLQKILTKLLPQTNKKNKQQKQNADPKDIRNRNVAKSMFTENISKAYQDLSPNKKTQKDLGDATLSSSRQQLKQLDICLFTRKDFTLFLNEETSFKYESNLKQKYHKSPCMQLTEVQSKWLTSLYNVVQLVKHQSIPQYNNILSFVKYPYQTVVNNFSILNIVKQMSLESWLWYMARIKHCHQKCLEKGDDKKMICSHIEKFAEKVENILVSAATCDLINEETTRRIEEDTQSKSLSRMNVSPKKCQAIK